MTTSKPLPEWGDKNLLNHWQWTVKPTDVLTDSTTAQVAMQLAQSPTEQYGTWGRIEFIHGKQYLIRPSMRIGKDGTMEEFVQKVPILRLKMNEDIMVRLLGLPLEAMAMTPAQQSELEKQEFMKPDRGFLPWKTKIWTVTFDSIQSEIDGILYEGFFLFKKVYEAFPDIASLTKEEATAQGLYPIINCRHYLVREWLAEKLGGIIPDFVEDSWRNSIGSIYDFYRAAPWDNSLEKLAWIGQAPFGSIETEDGDGKTYGVGNWADLASSSVVGAARIHAMRVYRDSNKIENNKLWQYRSASSVVELCIKRKIWYSTSS
jgi:hypothetical protein